MTQGGDVASTNTDETSSEDTRHTRSIGTGDRVLPPRGVGEMPTHIGDLVDDNNPSLQLPRMVNELFTRADNRHQNEVSPFENDKEHEPEGESQDANIEGDDHTEEWDGEMERLLQESKTPLFAGSPMNRLGTMLMLLNLCSVHGVSNNFTDELFSLLGQDVLPQGNTMPKSRYEAYRIVKKLGLAYDTIHACEDGCVLFRKDLASATSCPKCMKSRFVTGSATVPRKVLRHFPLIPRLKRMYRCSEISTLMMWHSKNASEDGLGRSVVDSKAWKHVDAKYPNFAMEPRNVRLGLALDGMNPFADVSTKHSTWPVLTINYNLPPWLVTKKFFIMLTLIIPGKESVKDKNIDVYLQPLVEELEALWVGVHAYDSSQPEGTGMFTLRAMLLWTIHDYPAYGLIAGCVTKGYQGCPICGPNVTTRMSRALRKPLFIGHRRYLSRHHPYRRSTTAFDGTREFRGPPPRVHATEVIERAEQRVQWLENGGRAGSRGDPVREHGIKRKSILFSLPYWEVREKLYCLLE